MRHKQWLSSRAHFRLINTAMPKGGIQRTGTLAPSSPCMSDSWFENMFSRTIRHHHKQGGTETPLLVHHPSIKREGFQIPAPGQICSVSLSFSFTGQLLQRLPRKDSFKPFWTAPRWIRGRNRKFCLVCNRPSTSARPSSLPLID